ncbi:MAG TPA: ABC transporter ATP-binding protein, partial [Geminicoccaceae bacterium]|nr:ABC transporter ATP-binding protein [Geminicoccaceae bacterium]
MGVQHHRRAAEPFRACLAFTFGHWRRQAALVAAIAAGLVGATLADVLMPLFAGRLIDAVAAADRAAALRAALHAGGAMIGLALLAVGLRHFVFLGLTRLTLRTMRDVAGDAFWRVQRFSTDWHANSFAGATVRRISRGMWALDLLNDTLLLALLPSLVVLAGSTLLLALHWPVMGLIVAAGALGYVALTVLLSLRYVAPAARLSNAWDTRVGAALADAVTCNAVVKAFGAEVREDARLGRVLDKWSRRTSRTWIRGTIGGSLQGLALVALRAAVVGSALWLWWSGRASPGDVAYVLTTYFVVQGYLRDVGMHVRNLQRSVNDMEELLAFHAEPLGVADHADARPIRIEGGRVEFERVGFHYRGHATPLYRDLSVVIRAGEKVGLVGHSGSGKSTFVKLIQRLHDL